MPPDSKPRANANWYLALYNLAATRTHIGIQQQDSRILHLAEDNAKTLLAATASRLRRRPKPRGAWFRRPSSLHERRRRWAWTFYEFLDQTVEPCGMVLWAGIQLERQGTLGESKTEPDATTVDKWSWLLADEWNLTLPELLAYVASKPALSFRVRYNLACLYSRAAFFDQGSSPHHLESSLGHLRAAVAALHGPAREALIDWAFRDPSLDHVRMARTSDFAKVMASAGTSIEQTKR